MCCVVEWYHFCCYWEYAGPRSLIESFSSPTWDIYVLARLFEDILLLVGIVDSDLQL